jgi:hypothetical protein
MVRTRRVAGSAQGMRRERRFANPTLPHCGDVTLVAKSARLLPALSLID